MMNATATQTAARSKALRLRLWMRTDQMTTTLFQVPCTSGQHVAHYVEHLGPNLWRCDCAAAAFGKDCCHVESAVYARAGYEVISPKRPAAHAADSAILAPRTSELRRPMAEDPNSIDLYASIQPMAAGR